MKSMIEEAQEAISDPSKEIKYIGITEDSIRFTFTLDGEEVNASAGLQKLPFLIRSLSHAWVFGYTINYRTTAGSSSGTGVITEEIFNNLKNLLCSRIQKK